MELFPSMSYQDIMSMPYRDFKSLYEIRLKRKIKEQKDIESERKKIEDENKRRDSSKVIRSGSTLRR